MSFGVQARAEGAPDYSVVPPHVKAAAERAEALSKAAREGTQAPQQAQEPTPAPTPAPAPAPEPKPAPTPAPTPAPAPESKPAPQEAKTGEDWQQRYLSLQGQFNSLNRQMRELAAENTRLLARVEELETAQPQPSSEPAAQFDIAKILTKEQLDDWGGEDFASIMNKAIGAATAPLHDEIRRLNGTQKNIATNAAVDAHSKMLTMLDQDIPDWMTINEDPEFVQWVNKVDEGSGKVRQVLLKEAYERNEGQRVKFFFNSFLREMRGAQPEAQRGQDKGQGRAEAPKPDGLTQFAAPGRGRQSTPPAAQGEDGPLSISRREIAAYFTDKAAGKLKVSPEEAQKFEREIDLAMREGRIVS